MAATRDLLLPQHRRLPARLLTVKYSRASGPGGQHVNKTSTRVDLRLDLEAAGEVLDARTLTILRQRLAPRLDAEGRIQVTCGEHREQSRNLEAAHSRLEALLRIALTPRKRRRATRPTRASKERRLDGKKRRSQIKRGRRGRFED